MSKYNKKHAKTSAYVRKCAKISPNMCNHAQDYTNVCKYTRMTQKVQNPCAETCYNVLKRAHSFKKRAPIGNERVEMCITKNNVRKHVQTFNKHV